MRWATFLHFYQPAKQQPDILEAVVAQSYRPLFLHFAKTKSARLTINLNGALFELFDRYGYNDLLDALRTMYASGRVEFTGTAKYHALFPFLDEQEAIRQITLNNETLSFYLGKKFTPAGFFPTEMAYKDGLGKIVESLGFSWMILDEIAFSGTVGSVDTRSLYRLQSTNLVVFFRERRPSNLIMSAVARTPASLFAALRDDMRSNRYVITAMDGETFGHHRPGLERLLFHYLASKKVTTTRISDLLKHYSVVGTVRPIKSTWASSEDDIKKGIQFLSWTDPSNPIHRWQWKLFRLALHEVHSLNPRLRLFRAIRKRMDITLASDHFWWASAKPWWSLEMIEDGAYQLLSIIRSIPGIQKTKQDLALHYYEKIISTAFEWQRNGTIRRLAMEQNAIVRIPFKDRTLGKGGAERGVWYAFLHMIGRLERKAASAREYEQAILWRDAIEKLEKKTEMYDLLNAINLVRTKIPHAAVEKTIERYKKKYARIRGGQPEQRGA